MSSGLSSSSFRHAWFRELPPILRGGVWMLLGTFAFAVMIILVRKTSQTFTAFEITFWRALIGLMFMTPWMMRVKFAGLRTNRPGLQLWRNMLHVVGIVLWYYAIAHINLTEGMALQFTVPLFTIALAMLILKERVNAARWIATFVGFAGVLVILRPGVVDISLVSVIVIVSAIFYAASNVTTKVLAGIDSPNVIVFYMNLIHIPLALIGVALTGWTIPGWIDLGWLIAVAASATLAHYCLAHALREADASLVMPYDFLKLPWVTLLAFLAFGEIPSFWGWIGGLVIFASVTYIVRRETRIGRAEMNSKANPE
jgi:drug/metabolite transporter (DMT)-like permease